MSKTSEERKDAASRPQWISEVQEIVEDWDIAPEEIYPDEAFDGIREADRVEQAAKKQDKAPDPEDKAEYHTQRDFLR